MKEIVDVLVDKTIKWLGEDGLKFFSGLLREYGQLSVVLIESKIPHPVHFHEGMGVRNFMRNSGLCKDWTDIDLDDNWCRLITMAIMRTREME